MKWIESLYQTYENCAASVGDSGDRIPLIPIAHIVQQTHIEISIDQDGVFQGAQVDPLITIIPCTEASAGRTNSPEAHPLSDKLKYVASDFFSLTGESEPKPSKKEKAKSHHQEYINLFSSWTNSAYTHPKLRAILKYLRSNEAKVIGDLCQVGIYPIESRRILKKWNGDKASTPLIYQTTDNRAPWDVFVRWRVFIPGEPEDRAFMDPSLWQQWVAYYAATPARTGLCYTTGAQSRLATQHPKRIRSIADSAKLISSNDSSGFTFRGRFTDPEGSQVCGVSFDVTQKAHNALRWLIGRQGRRDGDQAIVAWAVSGKSVPPLVESTDRLFDNDKEENFLACDQDPQFASLPHAEVAQDFALRLKKKIGGYRAELGNTDKIIVIALDSATLGRMSITYYRELAASEFLDRIEKWHRECAWFQNFGKDTKFIGAPAPKDIAACAYGRRLDEKLQAATQRRLLPCIIENVPVPRDIVGSCLRRASARQSMEHWEWEKSLGIACSLYRNHQTSLNLHSHTMSLERDRTTRSYLYGRLLAVADLLEGSALRAANEKRDTNAARFMQRFADHPYTTWRNIELSLDPYRRRLQANAPGLLNLFDKELREIMEQFGAEQFETDEKLEGEFLLAYHTQRTALWTKQPKDTVPNNPDEDPE